MDAEEGVDFGLSSWGLQSSSTFNSWALTSWRSVGTSANVERTFRSLGGREYFAHRNEVILRCGEMQSGPHLILDGTLQVLALGEVEKRQGEPWAMLKVGELQQGEMLSLPWLEKRPSRFSFRVQSKSLTAIMLTAAEMTAKTESYFSQPLAHEERRRVRWAYFSRRPSVMWSLCTSTGTVNGGGCTMASGGSGSRSAVSHDRRWSGLHFALVREPPSYLERLGERRSRKSSTLSALATSRANGFVAQGAETDVRENHKLSMKKAP